MDSIFIFGLMLVLFGPKKLPEIARQAGKLMMEFRRASSDFKMQMEDELRAGEQAERQKKIDAETRAAIALTSATTATTASLPDGSTVQIASDGTMEQLTPPLGAGLGAGPEILPPSVGEIVSTDAPNRFRLDSGRTEEIDQEAMPTLPAETSEHSTAEEFYAQRELELSAAPENSATAAETGLEPLPAEPLPAEPLRVDQAPAPAAESSEPGKLPGTEMYPDTAPMAESEQAPIRHD